MCSCGSLCPELRRPWPCPARCYLAILLAARIHDLDLSVIPQRVDSSRVGLTVTLEAVRITSNLVPLAGVAAEVNIIHRGQRRSRAGLGRAELCSQQGTCK